MNKHFFNNIEKSLAFYKKSDFLLLPKSVPLFALFVFLDFLTISCNQENKTNPLKAQSQTINSLTIPSFSVNKELIKYDNKTSTFSTNEEPFSGFLVSFYNDGTPKEKTGIFNGKKQNQATFWYPDGKLKLISNYNKGKLQGEKKMWSNEQGYTLIAQLNYENGKAHGEQKQWYKTGELYKKLNLNMGKEEGIQQAFRKNGELYANYEAKNGRIFGLKKAALCYSLKDENIKNEK